MARTKNVLMVSVPMPSYIQNYLKDTLRLTGFEAINVYRSFIEEYLNDSFGATNDDFLSWIKASEYAHLTKDNN